jgi:hypothetical protein
MAIRLLNTTQYEAMMSEGNYEYGRDTAELLRRIRGMRNGYLSVVDLLLTHLPRELPAGCIEFHCERTVFGRIPQLPPGLRRLFCSHMPHLNELPPLPDSLEILDCGYNYLESLPPLPPNLKKLHCAGNRVLTRLPPLPPTLESLEHFFTPLRDLPPLPPSLNRYIGEYNTVMRCETFPFKPGGCWPQLFILFNTYPGMEAKYDDPADVHLRRIEAEYDRRHEPRRARARCAAVKEELMAAAWSPRWGEERLDALSS